MPPTHTTPSQFRIPAADKEALRQIAARLEEHYSERYTRTKALLWLIRQGDGLLGRLEAAGPPKRKTKKKEKTY